MPSSRLLLSNPLTATLYFYANFLTRKINFLNSSTFRKIAPVFSLLTAASAAKSTLNISSLQSRLPWALSSNTVHSRLYDTIATAFCVIIRKAYGNVLRHYSHRDYGSNSGTDEAECFSAFLLCYGRAQRPALSNYNSD